jgi:hypothetical protein
LLDISKLIQEINHLEFLPGVETQILESKFYSSTSVAQNKEQQVEKRIFTLEKFNEEVFALDKRTDEILEHMFVYVRYVIEHTRRRYYDKLRFYEILVNQIHPTYVVMLLMMMGQLYI